MPIFKFTVVAGLALVALLFVANATLEPASPVMVGQRYGLSESRHPNPIPTLTVTPAPAPDMKSQAVLVAQPRLEPDALVGIGPAALAARAKAPEKEPKKDKRVTIYQQTRFFDRFSIGGY